MSGVLIENLIPLYLLIALGYIAGSRLDVNLHSMAIVAIFIVSPVVMFGGIMHISLTPAYLLLPVIIFAASGAICLCAWRLSSSRLAGNLPNLVGMCSATGNTGYYGLPVVLALLGPEAAGIYLLMNLGIAFSEYTFGYYAGARGHYDVRESIGKLLRLPALHAAWIALVCNALGVRMPEVFETYWHHFTGAWIVIGMMLIGIGLSKASTLRPNFALLGWLGAFRFAVWPAVMFCIAATDRFFLHLYDRDIHTMMLLIGLVPLGANMVAYAGHLNLPAGEAAMAVLLSTLFALAYLPFMLAVFSGLLSS